MKQLTKTQLAALKREEILNLLIEFFNGRGEDTMRESGNAIVFPSLDAEGNEVFAKIAVSIPRGDRSGEAYDGYAAAEDYKLKQEEIAAKRELRERERSEAEKKRKQRIENAKKRKEEKNFERAEIIAMAKEGQK